MFYYQNPCKFHEVSRETTFSLSNVAWFIFFYYICNVKTLPKALQGWKRVWWHLHIKAYLYALVLTVYELRNFKRNVKNKATGTPLIGVLYSCIGYRDIFLCLVSMGLIIHRCGAFGVARFDISGNAKAYTQGTSNKELAPRFFCICVT